MISVMKTNVRKPVSTKLLKIKDVSRLLGVSEATLRRWDRDGRFVANRHPLNNYRLYRAADVQRLVWQIAEVV